MGYLLDTNVISDLMRNPNGRVATAVAKVGSSNVATSILVVAEIRFGFAKRPSQRLERQFKTIIKFLPALDFEAPADTAYASLRAALLRKGKPIGAMDMLIAAQAMAGDHVLVSANEREFSRINGLKLENWLA